jgi:hypothetical protein
MASQEVVMRLLTFMLMGPLAWWLAAMAPLAHSQTASAAAQLSAYTALAGVPAQAGRGEAFFNVRHGRDWACASCHGAVPTGPGKHASTGKLIGPLAPAFNPERFSDVAKVEKWFRRNCNDVLARECSAAEKADVMAWLLTLRR